jgi:hypothetical protein
VLLDVLFFVFVILTDLSFASISDYVFTSFYGSLFVFGAVC